MPIWPVVFFAVALVSGVFGYAGISAASAGIAQILFALFLGLGLVALVTHVAQDWNSSALERGEMQKDRKR